ncbi:hypothetical protein ABEB36_004420 [Hypothenemus hampei]|uniref:Zinc finger PHD-type domain-containing protein n=1 Tax=Hypothenemus hampei TaxID=57062 RepID=A0ABD1F4S8_HYPHA
MHSQILTSSPQEKLLEEAQLKKRKRKIKISKIKKPKRQRKHSSSDEDENVDYSKLCDDDENDDIEEATEICALCGEFGYNNELWIRCAICLNWSHKECTSWTKNVETFICDFCT